MTFGNLIKTLREKKKLSQRELAWQISISPAELCRIETGNKNKIKKEIVLSLATILEFNYNDFLNYLEPSPSKEDLFLVKAISCSKNTISKPLSYYKDLENDILSKLAPILLKNSWSIELPSKYFKTFSNLIATRNDEKWIIDFKLTTLNRNSHYFKNKFLIKRLIYPSFGSLVFFNNFKISRFSILVIDLDLFEELKNYVPHHLDIDVSYIFFDLESSQLIEFNCK